MAPPPPRAERDAEADAQGGEVGDTPGEKRSDANGGETRETEDGDVWRVLAADAEAAALYCAPVAHALGLLLVTVAAPCYTLVSRATASLWRAFLKTELARQLGRRDLDPTFPAFVALVFVIVVCRTWFSVTPVLNPHMRPKSTQISDAWDASMAWESPPAPRRTRPPALPRSPS